MMSGERGSKGLKRRGRRQGERDSKREKDREREQDNCWGDKRG